MVSQIDKSTIISPTNKPPIYLTIKHQNTSQPHLPHLHFDPVQYLIRLALHPQNPILPNLTLNINLHYFHLPLDQTLHNILRQSRL